MEMKGNLKISLEIAEKDLKIYVCESICNQLEMKGNLKLAWKSVKREGKHSSVRNEERNSLV